MKLSKTNYLIYRDCAHNAWLKIHRPDVYNAKPLSVFDQNVIDTGNEVDVLARRLFPGGVLIERGDAGTTSRLVAERAAVLYQPVFVTDRFTTACDILVWNAASRAYDLYEVKSSTSGEDRGANDKLYTYDIAFQAEVLRFNRVPLGRLNLVRLDARYVRQDVLDIDALFTREDFSDRVADIIEEVRGEMDAAHDVLDTASPLPAPCDCIRKGRSAHCTTFAHTNPDVPAYGVHDITRIGASRRKLAELIDRKIYRIEDVPDDFALSEPQENQVRAAKTRRASIDYAAIADFLDDMSYPVAFLDYETYPCAVPRFSGYRPYQQIPFQFSLDVVAAPGAELVHHEFLHTTPDCPDLPLIAALKTAMPASGSIVVWNQSFERGINDALAERHGDCRAFFDNLDPRIVDLMDVFAMQAYVHPDFRGKVSIKNILPVLVPNLSYKQLAIQEGATATARWNEIVTGQVDAATAARLRTELLSYCGLDTLAMVEIWRVLVETIAPVAKTG